MLTRTTTGTAGLDWDQVTALLQPARQAQPPPPRRSDDISVDRLAAWLARQEQGNRNAALYWAANRALDARHDDLLHALADAARHTGLDDREITATLDSARRTPRASSRRDRQAEIAD